MNHYRNSSRKHLNRIYTTVRVKLICSLCILDFEKSASCWMRIKLARWWVYRYNLWVNKLAVYHELISTLLKCLKAHHSIAYKDGHQVDERSVFTDVISVNLYCQIRNIFASIWFTCNEKFSSLILWEFGKEIGNSFKTVVSCGCIIVFKRCIQINGKSYSCWRFEKE